MDAGVSLSGLQVPIWPINWQNRDKNVLTQSDWWAVHCWRYRSRDRVQCLGTGQHIWIVKCMRLTKNTPKIFGSYKYYWFTNSYDQMLDYYLTASVCTRDYKWSSESKFVNFLTKAVSVDQLQLFYFLQGVPLWIALEQMLTQRCVRKQIGGILGRRTHLNHFLGVYVYI